METRVQGKMTVEKQGNSIDKMLAARVIMAPMSGITDIPFRMMARRHGCRFAFTEMVDACGIAYGNIRTMQMLERAPGDSPLGAQIVGQDMDKILHAAKICEEKGFDVLDLNAGCPARKIIKCGKGAALLADPLKLAKMIRRLVKTVSIPVTVKIRSGWDENSMNYLEVTKAIASEGAAAVCIHSRTKEQMYKGRPDHDITREVKEKTGIPVIASGHIFTPRDVTEVFRSTGCDVVAVARGALGRPWLFREIYEHIEGEEPSPGPIFNDIKKVLFEHFSLSLRFCGEQRTFPRMYKHVCWYLKGRKNLNAVMKEYGKVDSAGSFHDFLDRLGLDEGNRLFMGDR